MKVKVKDIIVPAERARSRYTEEQRAFLKASLEKYGQLSEILVRPLPDGTYELIDGESRLNELKEAGAVEVEVRVLHLDDRNASLVNLLMNVARGEQDPMGSSLAITKALKAGMTEAEIAKATGHTKDWVRFMKSLQKLPETYQTALKEGSLKVTHIREALRLPDDKEADAALSAALTHGWTTSTMHHYVNNRLAEYEAARIRSEREGIEIPPPPPEPARLVKYAQCLICGHMVPREEISLPTVCSGCYELAKYVSSQFGSGEKGMNSIYSLYQRARAWDALQRPITPPGPVAPPTQPGPEPGSREEATSVVPERSQPISDQKLREMMRRIIREELERHETQTETS